VSDFDVIIIGGRPAGSTLAARLGRMGIRTLLLERQQFPSLPATSCPIVYAATMKLLDEIGADEAEYAFDTPQIKKIHLQGNLMQAGFAIPKDDGRDYGYAIDRARFDHALWNTAARTGNVTALQGFNVTDLLWEGEQVAGVTGKNSDGETVAHSARVVVGADGRYSMVARKVEAAVSDVEDDYPTSIYYAYWKYLKPYNDEGATSVAYEGTQPGIGYLVMDSADDTAAVAVEGQARLLEPGPGNAEAFYLEMLQANPTLWARFDGAQMITSVRGMKNIGNLYRQAGGPGWALVGDAYHQKDPLDGQGIYNAVFTAKALAWAIRYWVQEEKSWAEAVAWYDETARIKTYAMYKALMQRVKGSLYTPINTDQIPVWLQERVGRWIMEDPDLGQMYGRFLNRQLPADALTLMTPPYMLRAVARGVGKDMRERVKSLLPFS
jgi:flavin-dependent dehydrogenase